MKLVTTILIKMIICTNMQCLYRFITQYLTYNTAKIFFFPQITSAKCKFR